MHKITQISAGILEGCRFISNRGSGRSIACVSSASVEASGALSAEAMACCRADARVKVQMRSYHEKRSQLRPSSWYGRSLLPLLKTGDALSLCQLERGGREPCTRHATRGTNARVLRSARWNTCAGALGARDSVRALRSDRGRARSYSRPVTKPLRPQC
eukprot:515619-Pleurochrysis_carterae.AAC.3